MSTRRAAAPPWPRPGAIPRRPAFTCLAVRSSRVSAIGQLVETLLGRLAADEGIFGDATPFTELSVEAIAAELDKRGCDRHGEEVMYDPMTGQQFETTMFIGPTYYQRLKHMAADKIHQRARGPRQVLTHQPLEGRAREGGLRLGEYVRALCRASRASTASPPPPSRRSLSPPAPR